MKKLDNTVIDFFQNQGCVIVSTIDEQGFAHNSCKGIVKIEPSGKVYLLDLYKAKTFANLKNNPLISIAAFNEHKFTGYCLKGRAEIVAEGELDSEITQAWEERITGRLAQRLLKNIREGKGHARHPEALLPKPNYLIVMEVKEVLDLTPPVLK